MSGDASAATVQLVFAIVGTDPFHPSLKVQETEAADAVDALNPFGLSLATRDPVIAVFAQSRYYIICKASA